LNPEPAVLLSPATSKARRRLVPFLFLLYIVAYLDRINVGFASLQMNQALGFSSTAYGFGAGIFFVSYVLFEVPSNVILAKVGARRWIARIMITWGIVSSATMFVRSVEAFYVVRFLLGLAEAGFFPGIVFYLTHWFPQRERARTMAIFMTAVPIAGVIGGPVSGALLTLNGLGGLAGWQWLFLLEGVPAVILGFVVLRALPDMPRDARWLTSDEKVALDAVLAAEIVGREHTTGTAFRDRRTWLLAATYFTLPVTLYGIGFWLPQILRTSWPQASDFSIGLTSTIPYAVATVAMVVVGKHSDRTGERRFHVLVPAVAGAAGLGVDAALSRRRLDDGDDLRGARRRDIDVGSVLGALDGVSCRQRRRGIDRARELDGQHRRIRRSVPDRSDERCDTQPCGWRPRHRGHSRGRRVGSPARERIMSSRWIAAGHCRDWSR
jgi:sugar phosphate permease